jgi:predicted nucleic-acid-binding protein
MIRYAIDTNALISYISDRNIGQRETISQYIEKAGRLECEIYVVGNVVTELVYVLTSVYGQDGKTVHGILDALNNNPGMQIIPWCDMSALLDIWPDKIHDFGDAILASFADEHKFKVLTFDQGFQKQLKKLHIPFQVP